MFDTAVADVLFYSYIYLRHLGGFMGIFNPQIISRTQPLVIVSDLAKLKPLPLSGCSLKTTAPTYPFKRAALHSGYLGLLLICGVNELRLTGLLLASTESQSFNHCGQYEVNLHSPNHLLCSIELPLRYYLSVGSLVSKKWQGIPVTLRFSQIQSLICYYYNQSPVTKNGRNDRTRTCNLLAPNQAVYY